MADTPIISIKEARKLLGKASEQLSDDEVLEAVIILTATAKYVLNKRHVKKIQPDLGL